jgi:hypothetical protein
MVTARIDNQHGSTGPCVAKEIGDAAKTTSIIVLLIDSHIHPEDLCTSSHLDSTAPKSTSR